MYQSNYYLESARLTPKSFLFNEVITIIVRLIVFITNADFFVIYIDVLIAFDFTMIIMSAVVRNNFTTFVLSFYNHHYHRCHQGKL